ncbi:tyrosine-protein kinase, non-receptor Jak2 [Tanacetum coccineum]
MGLMQEEQSSLVPVFDSVKGKIPFHAGSRNFECLHHEIYAEVVELEDLRIPFDEIKFGKKIDMRGYGTLFEGEYNNQQVTLKRLNIIKPKLLDEILTVARFRKHPKVVALIGYYTASTVRMIPRVRKKLWKTSLRLWRLQWISKFRMTENSVLLKIGPDSELSVNTRRDFNDFNTDENLIPIEKPKVSDIIRSNSTRLESSNGNGTTPTDYLLPKSPTNDTIKVCPFDSNWSDHKLNWVDFQYGNFGINWYHALLISEVDSLVKRIKLQDTSVVEAKLSSRGSTSVASMYQTLSCMSKLSSRGSVRQCTSSDGDSAALGLAILDWLILPS